jgi:hypothetical protein
MRHVREILRLGSAGVSKHEIARRTGLASSTVRETLKRFAVAGLVWPLPDDVTDTALEARLYKSAGTKQGYRRQVEPDWTEIHRELKRKHVTLSILWDEYIERHPDGYRYSRYVAAQLMCRRRGKGCFPLHEPQHNFRSGPRATTGFSGMSSATAAADAMA